MNYDDFRYMRRGKQLASLRKEEYALLNPVNQRGSKKDHALLLLHGFSSSPAVYRYLIPQLKGYDAIVCPALPGHAQSIASLGQAKAADWLAATSACCAELIETYDKVDVVGLSLGGLLACDLSQQFALNHLYLLAPALRLHMRVNAMIKLAYGLQFLGFSHLRNAAGNILNNERAEIAYRKLPITAIIEMLQLARDYRWRAPQCPTDLFLGAHDAVVDSNKVESLFRGLPNVAIHWLNDSAHVLPMDNDLAQIVACINHQTGTIAETKKAEITTEV